MNFNTLHSIAKKIKTAINLPSMVTDIKRSNLRYLSYIFLVFFTIASYAAKQSTISPLENNNNQKSWQLQINDGFKTCYPSLFACDELTLGQGKEATLKIKNISDSNIPSMSVLLPPLFNDLLTTDTSECKKLASNNICSIFIRYPTSSNSVNTDFKDVYVKPNNPDESSDNSDVAVKFRLKLVS